MCFWLSSKESSFPDACRLLIAVFSPGAISTSESFNLPLSVCDPCRADAIRGGHWWASQSGPCKHSITWSSVAAVLLTLSAFGQSTSNKFIALGENFVEMSIYPHTSNIYNKSPLEQRQGVY